MPTVAGTQVPTTLIPRRYRGLYGLGGFWEDLLAGGVGTFQDIAKARWGQPPPGTAITTTPTSTQIIRQGSGATVGVTTFPGIDFGSGGSDLIKWALIAGVVVVGLKVISK